MEECVARIRQVNQRAYVAAQSNDAWAIPTACAATPILTMRASRRQKIMERENRQCQRSAEMCRSIGWEKEANKSNPRERMTYLPLSNVDIAIPNPAPAFPSRDVFDMRQFSKVTVAVEEALMPSLSSFLFTCTPGSFMSTMKQLIPLCLSDLFVVANTSP